MEFIQKHEVNSNLMQAEKIIPQDYSSANVRFKDQNILKRSFPNFELIRRKGKLCDVTLIADNQLFSAHKIVLAATIPFFEGMFLSGMSEYSKKEISIQGLNPGILEAFIIFAYTGEIQITPVNVQAVLIGASFLQIDSVRNFCCKYIEDRLSLENLISVRSFASSFFCTNLVAACDQIIFANFETLIDTPIFLSLSGPELIKLLESDDLIVSNEERVFQAVIAWCEHNSSSTSNQQEHSFEKTNLFNSALQSINSVEFATSANEVSFSTGESSTAVVLGENTPGTKNERLQYLPELLSRVRLPLLPAQFIRDVVSKHEFIRSDIRCRDLLDEARDLLLLPDSKPSYPCALTCRPRRGQEIPGVIYAVGGLTSNGDCQSIVEAYHPLLDRWEVVESMSTQRSRIAVVVLGNCLYAIGGLDGTSRLNTVEMFNPKVGIWQKVASMNYCRSALGAAVLNDRIYVCGGYDGISSLRTCEVYNPEQNRWQVIPSMTECRSAGGVVGLPDGRLFAIGGHNGLPIFASVECYHRRGHIQRQSSLMAVSSDNSQSTPVIPSGVWRQVAPMVNRRCRHGVSVLRGHIFAAGGYNGSIFLRSVEMFDPKINSTQSDGLLGQWTEISQMNTPRSRVALATSAGRLYAIGGFDGEKNLNSVECFQQVKRKFVNESESISVSIPKTRTSTDDFEDCQQEERLLLDSTILSELTEKTVNANSFPRRSENFIPEIISDKLKTQRNWLKSLTFQSRSTPSAVQIPEQFSDWGWCPVVPLIAHEGGVGVGVISIY